MHHACLLASGMRSSRAHRRTCCRRLDGTPSTTRKGLDPLATLPARPFGPCLHYGNLLGREVVELVDQCVDLLVRGVNQSL